jgi:DNA polymerase V
MTPKSRFFEFFAASEFEDSRLSTRFLLPLYGNRASAGFVSPADDYVEDSIDLNRYLIRNPSATFYVRVRGTSLLNAGINDGDLIVVDRSLNPKKNSVCLCILEGEFTLKFIRKEPDGSIFLVPANPAFKEIPVRQGMDFEVWGVCLHLIRTLY